MKIKNLLPLAFVFITQCLHGRSKTSFDNQKDSLDEAITTKIDADFAQALEKRSSTLTTRIKALDFTDTVHYRQLDGSSNMFDLRKEIAAAKGKKEGFVFKPSEIPSTLSRVLRMQTSYSPLSAERGEKPPEEAYFLLPLKNAEEIVANADRTAKTFDLKQAALYIQLDWQGNAGVGKVDSLTQAMIHSQDSSRSHLIVITSRFLQTASTQAVDFMIKHENGHQMNSSPTPDFVKDEKEFQAMSQEQKDSVGLLAEWSADWEAAHKIGFSAAQKGLSETLIIMQPEDYDAPEIRSFLKEDVATEQNYYPSGDHPTLAQRKYFLYLCEFYENNKDMQNIVETLVPEEAKPVWQIKYGKK